MVAEAEGRLTAAPPGSLPLRSVEDAAAGGSYVSFRLRAPAAVRCMLFVLPPGKVARFPSTGRIESRVKEDAPWEITQQLDSIRQLSGPVMIASARVQEMLASGGPRPNADKDNGALRICC